MSDITVICPECRQQLEATDDLLGEVVECPACAKTIQLSASTPAYPATRKKQIVIRKTTKRSLSTGRSSSSQQSSTKACPLCGEEILRVATKCKHCGSFLNAGGPAKSTPPPQQSSGCIVKGGACFGVVVLFIAIFGMMSDCGGPSRSSNPPPKPKTPAELRTKRIEDGFSAWDGSHRGLTALIKKGMNDPKSYEHVETTYGDKGDSLVVKTTFRGKNAFGGVVANWVIAKTDLDGNVIEVIAQGP